MHTATMSYLTIRKLPPSVHRQLKTIALAKRHSLNALVLNVLESYVGAVEALDELHVAKRHAKSARKAGRKA